MENLPAMLGLVEKAFIALRAAAKLRDTKSSVMVKKSASFDST